MAAARKPKFDEVLDGVRVRIYATRSEYEAIFNDDDITDPEAEVIVFPKLGGPGAPTAWAHQARIMYRS